MINNSSIINAIKNQESVFLCCKIIFNNNIIYCSNASESIIIDDIEYLPNIENISLLFENISINTNSITLISNDDLLSILKNTMDAKIEIYVYEDIQRQQEIIFSGFLSKIDFLPTGLIKIYFHDILLKLDCEIGEFFSPICVCEFGDLRCKKDISSNIFKANITTILSNYKFQINVIKDDGFFLGGYIEIMENNITFKTKIINHKNNEISILTNYNFKENQDIKLIQPCRKTLNDCKKFNNVINFRGQPFIK